MTLRGTVKGNTIVLDDGAELPEGTAVEVYILDREARWLAIAQAFADAVPAEMTDHELDHLIDRSVEEVRQELYDRTQAGRANDDR